MRRNLIKIRSCVILSDLTGLTGFLVTLRTINVFVFDWSIRKYETCTITLRLGDCKSQESLSLFLRHHELTMERFVFSN